MPHEINPFEPWRPRPDDTAREPADRPDWSERPPGPEPTWADRPPPRPPMPDQPPPRKPVAGAIMAWVTVGLFLVGLAVLGSQGPRSVSRIGAAAGSIWLGALIGVGVLQRKRWIVRVVPCLLGMAGAAACWFLVPTAG